MIQDEIKRHAPEHCRDMWGVAETATSRVDYFYEVFDKKVLDVIVPYTQPEMWYRNGWEPCKTLHINGSRIARREIYNANFRQWHWRVAGEQLIYSHVDRVDHEDKNSPFRYTLNTVRQLLIAGEMDNYIGSNIFDATRSLAGLMAHTPGRSLFLRQTGHSVHVERPSFLADQLVDFLTTTPPPATAMSMQITCIHREHKGGRIREVGGINHTLHVPFRMSQEECILSIDRGNHFFVIGADGSRANVRVIRRRSPKGGKVSYIATVHDGSPMDNLLSLPEC